MSKESPIVDSSVHIFFRHNEELRDYLEEPWKSRGIPHVEMDWYGAPDGEYSKKIADDTEGYPGSDPATVGRHLFEERGVDIAILHPMTRGTLPDFRLDTAIVNAHNQMLVSRWLEDAEYGDRFRGTIRVNPDDQKGAIEEIDRWAAHPRVVQIGIPLQSREMYGRAAVVSRSSSTRRIAGLPVAIHVETGTGINLPPTPSGHPRTYEHYATFMPLNYLYHLMNMIAEGLFESLSGAQGRVGRRRRRDGDAVHVAHGHVRPAASRADAVGAADPERIPGRTTCASSSRTSTGRRDGRRRGVDGDDRQVRLIMFGSSYPHWNMTEVEPISRPA